jgi:hypothetical protein
VTDTSGEWISGTWYTGSMSTSNVTPTTIHNQLSAGNATLTSQGNISLS